MALAALIIGSIALGVAILTLPTVFQMIWGRHRIAVGFDIEEFESIRVLKCVIYNNPVKNRLLRWLGVRRAVAEDIVADFFIEELGSHRVISPQKMPIIKSYAGVEPAPRISLAASPVPAEFGIVGFMRSKGVVSLALEESVTLANGSYCACVEVAVEGKVNRAHQNFQVTGKHPFVYWVGRIEKGTPKHRHIA